MSIDQLIYFISVCELGSFTKASKENYISQPAITLMIKKLEDELEVELFKREKNSIILTEEGKYLYNLAKPVVTLYNNIPSQMNDFLYKNSTLKIGIPPMLGGFIFAPLFEEFLTKHPLTNIKLFELASAANQKALINDEVDIALTVIYKNKIDKDIIYKKIDETHLTFVVSKKSPLANKKEITFEEISKIPIILLKEDSLQYAIVTSIFKKLNITPNICLLSNQIATIKELVVHGGHIGAFLFNQIIKKDDDLVAIKLKEDISFDIIIATKAHSRINKNEQNFIDFIEEKYKAS